MAREPLFSDTDEKTERVLIELLRDVPAWRKIEQVEDITRTCRLFALIGLRDSYPQASESELKLRLAARVFDRETVKKVYGWDTEKEGY
jgi:hypothetical protein